jgi:integrase
VRAGVRIRTPESPLGAARTAHEPLSQLVGPVIYGPAAKLHEDVARSASRAAFGLVVAHCSSRFGGRPGGRGRFARAHSSTGRTTPSTSSTCGSTSCIVDRLVAAGLSGSKVRNAIMPLRVIVRHAIEDDELTVNPTAHLRLPQAAQGRDRAATPDEAGQLLDALPDGLRALWATAFFAGLRRGELREFRWSDVDDAVTVLHVRRGRDDQEGAISTKNRRARKVPVGGALRRHLLEHKARTGRRGDDLVFGRTPSEPFTPSHVRKQALEAWAAAAVGAFLTRRPLPIELKPIGLHECRHTYVSMMHAAGCSLEEIGDYVGHSGVYMTDRYRHLLEGQREKAADRLDAFLAGAPAGAQGRQPAWLRGSELASRTCSEPGSKPARARRPAPGTRCGPTRSGGARARAGRSRAHPRR